MTFHFSCVHIISSSVWVAEWPPFGKSLLTRLNICSLFILTICNFSYFPFWFEGWIWVLIASFPGLCIYFSFFLKFEMPFNYIYLHIHRLWLYGNKMDDFYYISSSNIVAWTFPSALSRFA